MTDIWPTALECAAEIMRQAVPGMQVVVVPVQNIPAAACDGRWGANCGAVLAMPTPNAGTLVTKYPDNKRLMLHEAAHVVQYSARRPWNTPAAERDAERVAARWGECRW